MSGPQMSRLAAFVKEETGIEVTGMYWERAAEIIARLLERQRARNAEFRGALVDLSTNLSRLATFKPTELGARPEEQAGVLQGMLRAELARFDQQIAMMGPTDGVVGATPPAGFR